MNAIVNRWVILYVFVVIWCWYPAGKQVYNRLPCSTFPVTLFWFASGLVLVSFGFCAAIDALDPNKTRTRPEEKSKLDSITRMLSHTVSY